MLLLFVFSNSYSLDKKTVLSQISQKLSEGKKSETFDLIKRMNYVGDLFLKVETQQNYYALKALQKISHNEEYQKLVKMSESEPYHFLILKSLVLNALKRGNCQESIQWRDKMKQTYLFHIEFPYLNLFVDLCTEVPELSLWPKSWQDDLEKKDRFKGESYTLLLRLFQLFVEEKKDPTWWEKYFEGCKDKKETGTQFCFLKSKVDLKLNFKEKKVLEP